MLSIFAVIFLFSTVYSQEPPFMDGLPPGFTEKMHKFGTIYLAKCVKNLDPSKGVEINNAINSGTKCVSLQASSDAQNFCNSYSKEFITCLRNFSSVTKECLDANEKYLPDFLLNAQSRILNKYCKTDNVARLTKIWDSKCKVPLAQTLNTDFVEVCIPKLKIFQNLDKSITDYSLNKPDVCSDLTTIKDCIVNSVKSNCEIAKGDLDYLGSIFDEYRTECNFAKINVASFALLAALFAISRLFS